MSELNLYQPAQVFWSAPDEPIRQTTGDPGTVRRFSHLRDAVVFALEDLPERYRESVCIRLASENSLDLDQIKQLYAEIVNS